MSPEEATRLIAEARARDEFAYVEAVAGVFDEAKRLRWLPWRRKLRFKLFQVVADLDGDDKLILEAVDEARRFLERHGIACEPSADREYEDYLDSKSPFERHLMLAKQEMLVGGSNRPERDRKQALQAAVRHYEMAAKHGSLSKKHLAMVSQLRRRLES
jgi:hypothetical protein